MRAPRADTGIHPPSAGGATSVWGTASLVAVSAWPAYPPQR